MFHVSVPLVESEPDRGATLPLGRVWLLERHYSEVRSLVWAAKTSRRSADRLASLMADGYKRAVLEGLCPLPSYLVPVPGSPDRVAARGYDIPMLIAHAIGTALGSQVLNVISATPHVRQQQLKCGERFASATEVYSMACLPPRWYVGHRAGLHLVVDDVVTSGATVARCMLLLSRWGAPRVEAFAAGHPFQMAGRLRKFGPEW